MKIGKINTQSILAISALTLSIVTVIIYIYQARIMEKQHQDSVWPYVYSGKSLSTDDGLSINVYNKGIGPALIHSMYVKIEDKKYSSWQELMKSVGLDSITYSCSNTGVISPSEDQLIFRIGNYKDAVVAWQKIASIEIVIEYCSIHDECWKLENSKRTKIKNNNALTMKCG